MQTKWIDSHCHPHYEGLDESCVQSAIDAGIEHMLCVATEMNDVEVLQRFKQKYAPYVSISIGEHPLNENLQDVDWEEMNQLAANFDAIGETGFDSKGNISAQKIAFQRHAEIAQQHNLPIILHTRDCEEITMQEIAKYPNLRGVFHCFTGSKELAKFAVEHNWFVSFSGIVTFKNASALREALKVVPRELILIETDAPFLAPVPFRGKTNKPEYVKYVGEFVADLLETSHAEFAMQVKQNFEKFLNKEL